MAKRDEKKAKQQKRAKGPTKKVKLKGTRMSVTLKVPEESPDYPKCSEYVVKQIQDIIQDAIEAKTNRIFIRTNLKRGLPLENINKVAGPFVEAWAVEKFEDIADDPNNKYELVNVQAGKRLDPYDIILQFKRKRQSIDYVSAMWM